VPASWPVAFDLNVNGKCPADTSPYRWVWQVTELSHATKTPLVADTGAFTGPIGDQCEFDHTFPELGVYRVTTTTYKQISPGVYAYAGTHTQQVNVRDYLIVGLGDSIASGDGAPDIKASPVQGGAAAMWEYAGCRRSANSYQAQAALALEQADPHTSVTFLHLACAGAAVNSYSAGMYGSAGGIPQQPLSYQLSVMSGSIGGRVPDALIISIGENDIGFWDALYFCAEKPSWAYRPHASSDCFAVPYPFQTSKASLGKVVQQATTKTLPADYAQLHLDLKAAGIPADRVYLVEYPDPLSAINAKPSKQDNLVDNAEARWLSQVVQGVNKQARLAATRYGWHYIGGIFSGFAGHGYLAPANTRWVEGSVDSLEAQGAVSGALHPNAKGYAFMAGKVAPALLQNFYPGGKVG
jgi:lysophospholipase L1-like esterase